MANLGFTLTTKLFLASALLAGSVSAQAETKDVGVYEQGFVTLFHADADVVTRTECAISGSIGTGDDLRSRCTVPGSRVELGLEEFKTRLVQLYLEKEGRTELNYDDKLALEKLLKDLKGRGVPTEGYLHLIDVGAASSDRPTRIAQKMASLFDQAMGLRALEGTAVYRSLTNLEGEGDFYFTMGFRPTRVNDLSVAFTQAEEAKPCDADVVEVLHTNLRRPGANDWHRLTTEDGLRWKTAEGQTISGGTLAVRVRNQIAKSHCLLSVRDMTVR